VMTDANQEHGILAVRDGRAIDWTECGVGTRLRILPNHACATAAQHGGYVVVRGSTEVTARWDRFGGW
jgi:D-serine deaminase-like pyridoxal phosphate-dependent protein